MKGGEHAIIKFTPFPKKHRARDITILVIGVIYFVFFNNKETEDPVKLLIGQALATLLFTIICIIAVTKTYHMLLWLYKKLKN